MKRLRLAALLAAVFAGMLLCPAALAEGESGGESVIDPERRGTLTLYKYEVISPEEIGNTPATGEVLSYDLDGDAVRPLPGVTFSIKRTEDLFGNPVQDTALSLETDARGKAAFTELPLGKYLVRETVSPEHVTQKTPDFEVYIPMTNAAGDGWNYDVVIYPKNQTIYGAAILKKTGGGAPLPDAVFSLEQYDAAAETWRARLMGLTTNAAGQIAVSDLPAGDYRFVETAAPAPYLLDTTPVEFTVEATGAVSEAGGAFDIASGTVVLCEMENFSQPTIEKTVDGVRQKGKAVGEAAVWEILVGLPGDIGRYETFVVTDALPAALTLTDIAAADVRLDGRSLTAGTHYRASFDSATRVLKIVFRDEGFSGRLSDLAGGKELTVAFDARLTAAAPLGTAVENTAALTFNNGFIAETTIESAPAEVHTGGIRILKYALEGGETVPLSGAQFALYESEAAARAGGAPLQTARTGEGGIAMFSGLAYGTDGVGAAAGAREYWLVETRAPQRDGRPYSLLKEPVKVVVTAESHSEIDADGLPKTRIRNRMGFSLPATGGMGTLLFTICGAALMAAAVVLYVIRKRAIRQK